MASRYIGNHHTRCDRLGDDLALLIVVPTSATDDARDFRAAPNNLRVVTDVDHNVHTIRDPKGNAIMHARSAIDYVRSEHRSILEGLDEILTVSRLGLPAELRRSLACTNIIENMMGTVRRVTRNVKRWSSPSMALRWTAAAMQEAKKGFRRLKAYKQLPALRAALAAHYERETNDRAVAQTAKAA